MLDFERSTLGYCVDAIVIIIGSPSRYARLSSSQTLPSMDPMYSLTSVLDTSSYILVLTNQINDLSTLQSAFGPNLCTLSI